MSKENWVPFYFESNQCWGMCNNKKDWDAIKKIYCAEHGSLDLSRAMVNNHREIEKMKSGEEVWDFGFRIEHQGAYSLADFSKDNNVIL